MITNTWFARVWRADKRLFTVCLLFFGFTLIANFIRLQTTPFFIWDMYSRPMTANDDQSYFEVRYNDHQSLQLSHTWQEPRKQMLFSPLAAYYAIKNNHGQDPFQDYLTGYWLRKHPSFSGVTGHLYPSSQEIAAFPNWYKRFLTAQTGEPVHDILIILHYIRFNKDASITRMAADTVLTIP